MRLAKNESRRVGMEFEALVELSRYAEGMKPIRVHTVIFFARSMRHANNHLASNITGNFRQVRLKKRVTFRYSVAGFPH